MARADGTVLLSTPKATSTVLPRTVGWRTAKTDVTTLFGQWIFEETAPALSEAGDLKVESSSDKQLVIGDGVSRTTIDHLSDGVLRVTVTPPADQKSNRTVQTFACDNASDGFFGLGGLVHGTNHRGEVVPTWISEQGVGKIRRGTPTAGFPIQGDVHDAYLSVPFVMSTRGFGLLVENSQRNLFHLCDKRASDRWAVETWHGKLSYLLVDGPHPATVLKRLTARSGRPKLSPKWALGPWVDIIHGQTKVKSLAATLRKAKIPASAIWTEDWIGAESKNGGYHLKYRWIEDKTLYPDLKGLIKDLHAQGLRFLGYFNPFIEQGFHTWTEAQKNGYYVKDDKGKILTFQGVFFKNTTLPDLTDPTVVSWIRGYMHKALDLGMDGWMADYAEWLPLEAKLKNGMSGAEAHNLYPVWWQKLNRELLDDVRKDGDYTFFVRSGWTGTGGQAPVVWAGDQQTEFGGYDGMQSVIPLCLNMGMAGIPITTHDIGGYSTENTPDSKVPARTKELFYRWTELGAFSPVMRTHHGAKEDQNWQWNQDAATMTFFAKMAQLHVDLFPYRYSLAKVASETGMPMMRHMALHYLDDVKTHAIKDQYLLGQGLLVAPVQTKGATSRKVYLPKGRWYDYFTGKAYEGGKEHTVTATLEQIPVFAAAGAIIPKFLTKVDTLDKAPAGSGLKGIAEAEAGPLGIDVYLGTPKTVYGWTSTDDMVFDLYDGTGLMLLPTNLPTSTPSITVAGKEWPTCSSGATTDCVKANGGNAATVYISATSLSGNTTTSIDGFSTFSLKLARPAKRDYAVTFHW